MFRAVEIDGEPVPEASTPKDAKKAEGTAKFWARRVAFEVAERFPDCREEAEVSVENKLSELSGA